MSERVRAKLALGWVLGLKEANVCRFSDIPYGQAPIVMRCLLLVQTDSIKTLTR